MLDHPTRSRCGRAIFEPHRNVLVMFTFKHYVAGMARSNAAQRRPPVKELPSAPAGAFDDVSELLGVVVDHERRRGRGAQSNASGRYEPLARVAFDDGWRTLDELPPFKTTVTVDATRKIITRNESPDIGFDRSINPYRGCEHGCIYCFARPTTSRRLSRSAPIPIHISRSSVATKSCAGSWKCLTERAIQSASLQNRRWCCAISTSWPAWLKGIWRRSRS